MDSQQTWVEALKISPEMLGEWSTIAPSSMPLLVWCLQQGHVSVSEYMEWATQHYGLPQLNNEFFQSFDRGSLNRESGPWSAWCFPVGQWEDVTLIACVEPPADTPDGTHALVLADPTAMQEVWGPSEEAKAEVEVPVGISQSATRTFVLNLDDSGALFADSEKLTPNEKKPAENTGLTLSVVANHKPVSKAEAVTAPISLNLNKPPAAPPAKVKPASAPVTSVKLAAVPATEPPPIAPKPLKKPVLNPAAEEAEIRTAFERLKQDYKTSLIMKCADKLAKPYKWDGDLPITAKSDKSNIDLNVPSFFRIVAKTMQPYHGYVIDSPTHREFFGSLNFAEPPACVTAIPIKMQDKLWGILVAFGGEPAQTADALSHALTVSDHLSKALEPTWSKAS